MTQFRILRFQIPLNLTPCNSFSFAPLQKIYRSKEPQMSSSESAPVIGNGNFHTLLFCFVFVTKNRKYYETRIYQTLAPTNSCCFNQQKHFGVVCIVEMCNVYQLGLTCLQQRDNEKTFREQSQ